MQAGRKSPGSSTDDAGAVVHYPEHLERRLHLDDDRVVFVRPILPTDGPTLRATIAEADADTLRARFLGWIPEPSDELIHHLTHVDYRWRLALVAFSPESTGVAIARYEGKPGSDVAEAAVVVDPEWRRVGLGIALVGLLRGAALRQGIRRFWATFMGENMAIQALLRASRLPHTTKVSAGRAEETVDLSPVVWLRARQSVASAESVGRGHDGWQGQAGCRGMDPDIWYRTRDQLKSRVAFAICGQCPVRQFCLDDALERRERLGIRGGKTPGQRRAILARRALGTESTLRQEGSDPANN
jgi:GNAT superfamily N-acetyltransferase